MPESMKTIAIDCRFAATHSGLGRYTRELVTALVDRVPEDMQYALLVRSPDEAWIPAGRNSCRVIHANIPHYSLGEHLTLPSLIRDSVADLFFSPHFNVPLCCPVPFVMTIHDLILHRYPNNASRMKQKVYRFLIRQSLNNAQSIIAISNFVKNELKDAYGEKISSKVHVVHEGVSPLYRPASDEAKAEVMQKYTLNRPFFLYVGNAKQHKNVSLLLQAFTQAGETGRDLLLITGGKEAASLGPLPPNVRRLDHIPDAEMPVFYSLAEACVTASLYEGFCLPVVEALACGCPMIATNRSVIPEVAGSHALLLEPTVAAYRAAFTKQYQRKPLYLVGTWEEAAEETEMILKKAVGLF